MTEKPVCILIGEDSNVFNLIGIVSKTLKRAEMSKEAGEMSKRCFGAGSYDECLNIFQEYVEVE
jgi:hypothetical protein